MINSRVHTWRFEIQEFQYPRHHFVMSVETALRRASSLENLPKLMAAIEKRHPLPPEYVPTSFRFDPEPIPDLDPRLPPILNLDTEPFRQSIIRTRLYS